MNLESMKLVYAFSCAVLCLIILFPTLMVLGSFWGIDFPAEERFSELWILGPNHMAEGIPLTVSANQPYHVYLGVGNHLGELEYYAVRVKFGNQVETAGDREKGLPSPLEPILEYRLFLSNNQTWEMDFAFSFEDVSFEGNVSTVSRLVVDGHSVAVDDVATWDAAKNGFFYMMVFELWIYDKESLAFQYHDRSVGMWLNMSVPS